MLCLLKKKQTQKHPAKPTTINCFLETLLWTWGEVSSQEKSHLCHFSRSISYILQMTMPTKKHWVPSHPAAETKTDTLSFNKWSGWANYTAKENSLYLRICQLRHFLPKLVKRAQIWWATCSQREQSQHSSWGAVLSGLSATSCLDLAPFSLSSATIHNTIQVSRKSPDCSQSCSCSKGWP